MHAASPSRLFPVAAILIGAAMWGVIWYPLRLLEGRGLAGLWLTFAIYAVALVASLPRTARSVPSLAREPMLGALLMLTAGWTNIAFVEAVLAGNILRVLLLFYLSPLWAVLLARVWLGERISPMAAASLALAMTGALVMLWLPGAGLPVPRDAADWYAISAGFAFAVSNVVTRKASALPVAAKAFAVWAGVVVVGAVMLPFSARAVPDVAAGTLGWAALLGVTGILVMTWLVQYGVTNLPIVRSAVLALIELVVGAVSQQLLTDEVVTWREWWGGALIVIGAVLAARAVALDMNE
jgi:drug/metabolite transporter (DMT)-like permease